MTLSWETLADASSDFIVYLDLTHFTAAGDAETKFLA